MAVAFTWSPGPGEPARFSNGARSLTPFGAYPMAVRGGVVAHFDVTRLGVAVAMTAVLATYLLRGAYRRADYAIVSSLTGVLVIGSRHHLHAASILILGLAGAVGGCVALYQATAMHSHAGTTEVSSTSCGRLVHLLEWIEICACVASVMSLLFVSNSLGVMFTVVAVVCIVLQRRVSGRWLFDSILDPGTRV